VTATQHAVDAQQLLDQAKSLALLQGRIFPGYLILPVGLQAFLLVDLMTFIQIKQRSGGNSYDQLIA